MESGVQWFYDSMKLANLSWDPCGMWLHYIWYPVNPPPSSKCSGATAVGTVFDPFVPAV